MAGPSDTLGSSWPPLAIRLCSKSVCWDLESGALSVTRRARTRNVAKIRKVTELETISVLVPKRRFKVLEVPPLELGDLQPGSVLFLCFILISYSYRWDLPLSPEDKSV
jgi:hypothetical protein